MIDFGNYVTMQTSRLHDIINTPYNVLSHNDNRVLIIIKINLIKSNDTNCDVYILVILTQDMYLELIFILADLTI